MNFIGEMISVLNKLLTWSYNFSNGIRDYEFDIDDELFALSKKYEADFSDTPNKYIYNLLDFYCDAVKHEFVDIHEGYSVEQAEKDILEIRISMEKFGEMYFIDDQIMNRIEKV